MSPFFQTLRGILKSSAIFVAVAIVILYGLLVISSLIFRRLTIL